MFKRTPSLLCAILSLFLSAATYASPWRFHGFLQAGLSADTIYPDPYLSSSRTPVFGEDGSGQASTDNSCIPRFLFEDGSGIKNCRDLSFDTPVYGGSISGSTLGVRRDWEKSSLVMEAVSTLLRIPIGRSFLACGLSADFTNSGMVGLPSWEGRQNKVL